MEKFKYVAVDVDKKRFRGSFLAESESHLREQLAQPLRKFCRGDFDACFAAESLLVWTMAGTDFAEIYAILKKLF